MDPAAQRLIEMLGLVPHPEGGYYREVFRAKTLLDSPVHGGQRNASTAIYFLLPAGTFSAFHAVHGSDEVWHHYDGDPLELHLLDDVGNHTLANLGRDFAKGQRPQVVVPAGVLQAAVPVGDSFTLCGCTVAPGFDFRDFEIPARSELLGRFPAHRDLIERLSRR